MPRYPQRKHDALQLLERLQQGPHLGTNKDAGLSVTEAERRFKIWAESWIIPQVKQLIPELAKLQQEGKLK